MGCIIEDLRRCCEYRNVTDEIRRWQSGATNGMVLDAADEIERLRTALRIADESIRHHLRCDTIAAAIIQPHAVKAIREAMGK